MSKKWYRETIEALGMRGREASILNKLNAVAAHSEDAELRSMAEGLIREIRQCSSNLTVSAPKDLKNGVPSAERVLRYCQERAY